MSGVPHGTVMGVIVFNIFKAHLNDGIECTLTKSAEGGEVVAPEERATIERDLSELEDWAKKNYMSFSKVQREVLHME